MSDDPRLMKGWPHDPTAEYTATWENIQKRIGFDLSLKDKTDLRKEGIVMKRSTGRPPNRIQYVFTYWPDLLKWLNQKKRSKLIFL